MHTGWFPPELLPVRAGVYQRDYAPNNGSLIGFCYWNGEHWFGQCEAADEAIDNPCISLVLAPWRGLALQEFVARHRDLQTMARRRIEDATP